MNTPQLFLVSYDLNRPRAEDAYPELIGQLKRDDAVKILYSEWLVRSTMTPLELTNRYLAHMDANDSICVVEVNNAAWFNIMNASTAVPILKAA